MALNATKVTLYFLVYSTTKFYFQLCMLLIFLSLLVQLVFSMAKFYKNIVRYIYDLLSNTTFHFLITILLRLMCHLQPYSTLESGEVIFYAKFDKNVMVDM